LLVVHTKSPCSSNKIKESEAEAEAEAERKKDSHKSSVVAVVEIPKVITPLNTFLISINWFSTHVYQFY
jgi:hypothetical protein